MSENKEIETNETKNEPQLKDNVTDILAMRGGSEKGATEVKINRKDENVSTQADIEEISAEILGMDKDLVKLVFNTVWGTICTELELGRRVKLHGKGQFYLSKRSERMGRNPQTGVEYIVPAREAMAFQTSPAYAKRLRKQRKKHAKQQALEDMTLNDADVIDLAEVLENDKPTKTKK